MEHPDELALVTQINENEDDDGLIEDEVDSTEDELQRRLDKMTFVVSTRKLEQLPHWINEHTRQMSSSSGILALGRGDHGSKYRGEVFVPGRQDMFPKAREPSSCLAGAPTSLWHLSLPV